MSRIIRVGDALAESWRKSVRGWAFVVVWQSGHVLYLRLVLLLLEMRLCHGVQALDD